MVLGRRRLLEAAGLVAGGLAGLAVGLGPGRPVLAADLPVAAFVGIYQGSGAAEGAEVVPLGLVSRDLDVTIRAQGGGLQVSWTIVQAGQGRGAKTIRRGETVEFLPTAQPNVFRAARPGDPLAGQPLYWARIRGQTLTVFALQITSTGSYEMLSWARTLTANGMELVFRRLRDGEAPRVIRGRLAKADR